MDLRFSTQSFSCHFLLTAITFLFSAAISYLLLSLSAHITVSLIAGFRILVLNGCSFIYAVNCFDCHVHCVADAMKKTRKKRNESSTIPRFVWIINRINQSSSHRPLFVTGERWVRVRLFIEPVSSWQFQMNERSKMVNIYYRPTSVEYGSSV